MARHVVLHIGDTHLHPGPRQADRIDALEQIAERARALHESGELALIVWPGDFFHQKSSPEDRNILARVLRCLAELAPIVGVYGNHDVPGDLDVFTKLSTRWPIAIVDTPQVIYLRSATKDTKLGFAVFCLPYPHRAGLVSAGAEHASIGQEAEHALDAIFLKAAADLVEARGDGFVPMTIGHINVGGSIVSSGQPNIGQEIELTPALLERLPSGPVALNHIHRHQMVGRALYAGSIARMDFGEMERKVFIEYVFDDQASQAQWSSCWRPLDVPQQFDITGDLLRYGFVMDPVDGIGPEEVVPFAGSDVRVRYRYLKADAGVIDVDQIRQMFAGCRSLKLEGQPQLTHEMRAPEIAAAVTLEEKVAKYCERHKIVATVQFRMKLAALQTGQPENILAELQRILSAKGAAAPEQAVA